MLKSIGYFLYYIFSIFFVIRLKYTNLTWIHGQTHGEPPGTKHSHQRSWGRREKQRGNWGEWIWLSSLPFPHNRVFVWFCLFRFSLHPLANPSSLSAWKRLAKARNQPDFPTPISEPKQRPINISPGLCIKTRLSAQPLIWKLFFILMMIKIIFTRN